MTLQRIDGVAMWLALLLATTLGLQAAAIQHQPREVLLVYNADSPVSTAVAKDYAARRGVHQMVAIHCIDSAVSTDNETIPLADYQKQIAAPVEAYLVGHPGINFIVLTKGVPLRIEGGATGSRDFGSKENYHPSVDSYLAAIDYPRIPGAVKIHIIGSGGEGYGWLNRYWNTDVPFTHRAFGGYLVTRLDGYTQADALSLVAGALAAEQHPPDRPPARVLLDAHPGLGMIDKPNQPFRVTGNIPREVDWGTWNADLARAGDILEASGFPVLFDATPTFVGNQSHLLGYFSFGSNDPSFHDSAYQSLRFAPGSIGDTAVSTSARTFLPTTGGQSLTADLIAHGLTCSKGYCNEPLLQAIASPSVTLAHYLSGYTMAESFYAASRFVGWEDIVVGDPLCRPYPGGHVTLPIPASDFVHSSGITTETCREGGLDVVAAPHAWMAYKKIDLIGHVTFVARAASPQKDATIAIHLDKPTGPLLGTCHLSAITDGQAYVDSTCALKTASGRHLVYLAPAPGIHLQWIAFRRD